MKKTIKSLAYLMIGLLATSCVDDNITDVYEPAVEGGDILFGASANFENGDAKNTRTSYGKGDAVKGIIPINWENGDKIDIHCEEAGGAANLKEATYQIQVPEGQKSNKATTIVRVTPNAGLQWGNVNQEHNFYAIYPAAEAVKNQFQIVKKKNRLIAKGHFDSQYTCKVTEKDLNTKTTVTYKGGDGFEKTTTFQNKEYELVPDMNLCYMAVDKTSVIPSANGSGVNLLFKPIVTALEFEIVGNVLSFPVLKDTYSINIKHLTLVSNNKNIVGNFDYDFSNQTIKNKSVSGANQLTLKSLYAGGENNMIPFREGDKCKATFFISPDEPIATSHDNTVLAKNDLKLQIVFEINNITFVKTAVIGKDIMARKKYYFSNMNLPPIKSVGESNWFSAIGDNVLVSQLSIPVSGNAFSYAHADEKTKPYIAQQRLRFDDQWTMGARGFEIRTAGTNGKSAIADGTGVATTDAAYFGNARVVCSGRPLFKAKVSVPGGSLEEPLTMDNIFKNIAGKLQKNPLETIVLIITYQTHGNGGSGNDAWSSSGNNPLQFVKNLEAFMANQKDVNFVKLDGNSTAKDIRGKVAIIVRPGDELGTNPFVGFTPTQPISIINDWGTSIDNWDIRYGNTYKRQGVYDAYGTHTTNFEVEHLNDWGAYWSKTQPDAEHLIKENAVSFTLQPTPTYSFSVNNEPDKAMVQCWERIIPSTRRYLLDVTGDEYTYGEYFGDFFWHAQNRQGYLWFGWPESLSEKKNAVSSVVRLSEATKGVQSSDVLFINSLSGYFPVDATLFPGSAMPFDKKRTIINQTIYVNEHTIINKPLNLTTGGQVTGGDYASCAATMNTYMYDMLNKQSSSEAGPLGLIMFDYIGAGSAAFNQNDINKHGVSGVTVDAAVKASKGLISMIVNNNFKFPLAVKGGGEPQKPAQVGENNDVTQFVEEDGNVISFE